MYNKTNTVFVRCTCEESESMACGGSTALLFCGGKKLKMCVSFLHRNLCQKEKPVSLHMTNSLAENEVFRSSNACKMIVIKKGT